MIPHISLFASAVRPHLWPEFFKSLESTKLTIEVVFAGDIANPPIYPNLKYINTGRIKPAQCYEIARRYCSGEMIGWVCDDMEADPFLYDECYEILKNNSRKTIIAISTNEDGVDCDVNDHRFFSSNVNTPQMAPLNLMYRNYLEELGGYDRRYISGQTENDVMMRAFADGGNCIKYCEKRIRIEHIKKHGGDSKFWNHYDHDRHILEDTWCIDGYKPYGEAYLSVINYRKTPPIKLIRNIVNREVSKLPLMPFEPFSKDLSLTHSESFHEGWE